MILPAVVFVALALSGAPSPVPQSSPPPFTEPAMDPLFEVPSETTIHYVALLMKGPQFTAMDTAERRELRHRRRRHLRALSDSGYLIAAGPVPGRGPVRGILLLRASSLGAAQVLVAQDPAVQAGRLVVEVYPWHVDKALFQDSVDRLGDAPSPDNVESLR